MAHTAAQLDTRASSRKIEGRDRRPGTALMVMVAVTAVGYAFDSKSGRLLYHSRAFMIRVELPFFTPFSSPAASV